VISGLYDAKHADSKNWPMTELHQIDLTKKSLAAMSAAGRKLLLLLGQSRRASPFGDRLV
jgi:hypothetical protein